MDGKTCEITSTQFSNNNQADTMLEVFEQGVRSHGLPSWVHGNHGTENVRVADHMLELRGNGRGSYLWGQYVCNIDMHMNYLTIDISQLCP